MFIKETVKLDRSMIGSILWNNIKTGKLLSKDTSVILVADSGRYRCTIRDSLGCVGSDSMRVYINPNLVGSANGKTKCKGDTVQMITDSTGGGKANYWWYKVTKMGLDSFIGSGRKMIVNPPVTTDYMLKISETTAGVTCRDSEDIQIKINALPAIKFSVVPSICINASPLDLNKYVSVNGGFKFGGIWSSRDAGLIGSSVFPVDAGVGYALGEVRLYRSRHVVL